MKKIFSLKIPFDLSDYSEYQIFYKKLYLKILIMIALPVCAAIGIKNILTSQYVTGIILMMMVLVLGVFIYNLVRQPETKRSFLIEDILIRFFLIFSVLSVVYSVGVEHSLSRALWFLIFPLILIFSTSILEAAIWTVCITVLLVYLLFFTDLNTSLNEIFNLKVKIIVLYATMVVATFIISQLIRSVLQNLFEKQKEISNTNLVLKNEIEDRKKTEDALRESEERYRMITENIADVVWTTDMDLNFIYVSPSVLQQRGYTVEEAMKHSLDEIIMSDSLEKAMVLYIEKMELIKAGDPEGWEPIGFEAEQPHKDGKIIFTHNYARMLPGPDGEPASILGISRDITKQKKAEEEKIKSQIIAGEQKKLVFVGQIAGKMAHDFNNILGIIMGNAELSLMDFNEAKAKKAFELIVEQTLRGRNLTKNLVAFAKDQEPKQEFFMINEKIDLVINLMRKDLEGIKLVKEEGANIPDLLADPGMIEHALVNLLQNSIHATSMTKKPVISIRTFCDETDIFFEIKDNGCGIPKEHFKDIYNPAFTLKGSRDITRSYQPGIKGTGYGMSNVKKYIDQHKGSILLDSKPGKGTTFVISFPVIQKELTKEEKELIKKEKNYFEKYILLVEDEQAISDVQYTILTNEPCNHRVDVASNASAAIDLFERNEYDLISLDYVLPGDENGMDVYNHIRKTNQNIPILFISGNIEFLESIKRLKQEDNYISHVSKPCQNKEYISNVNDLLGKIMS